MLMSAETKLAKLRELMKCPRHLPEGVGALSAYIVPSEDAHYSEYTAPQHKRRQFLSGFSGSAGTAVVTMDKALLWTDGRYFTQALAQLDSNLWQLMKAHVEGTPELQQWLADNCASGSFIGADPMLISQQNWEKWHKLVITALDKALEKSGSKLVSVSTNLVDEVWSSTPEHVTGDGKKVFVHPLEYSGEEWGSKVQRVRERMAANKCDLLVLAELDEICWLFNLRGSDIEFNPVFFAFSIVTSHDVYLFVDSEKLDQATVEHLKGAQIKPYEDIVPLLKNLASECVSNGGFIWMATQTNHALANEVLKIDKRKLILKNTPVKQFKAVKNEVEIQGMKEAHIRDGLALCEYLCYLDKTVPALENGDQAVLTESSGAQMLDGLRSEQDKFVSLSFETITGSGPNGAIIHYSCTPETSRPLCKDELYLVDSGGQYLDGTTDVTRTVSFSDSPDKSQMEAYTLVLKGHIALAQLVIPAGTLGHRIDCVARQFLWKAGLNYLHGTGHGVGSFLNVHEGPQSISYRTSPNEEGLKAGMIVSNEPGYYKTGHFGIRIESLMVYQQVPELCTDDNDSSFIKPETITCVPLDRKLIDKDLLTDSEIVWVDDYHEFCWKKLVPLAEKQGKTELIDWLKNQTAKL